MSMGEIQSNQITLHELLPLAVKRRNYTHTPMFLVGCEKCAYAQREVSFPTLHLFISTYLWLRYRKLYTVSSVIY